VIQKLKNFKHLLTALFALSLYRYPAKNLKVIGVTGTDGKTTTVNLVYHLLNEAGLRVMMISTLGAKIGKKKIKTGYHITTPEPLKIQRLLQQAVEEKIEYAVLEATSHGLDQFRLLGCHFMVGVVTNVTNEHLDYHRSWKNYLQAKAKLFQGVKYAVLNKNDRSFDFLRLKAEEEKAKIITYALDGQADFTLKSFPFKTRLIGEFNQLNCLAALAVAKIFKIPDQKIRQALWSFKPLKGRLEEIKSKKGFKVFVDFAHTPAAFKQVIPTVRKLTRGRIIHVFGCTGDRDWQKRPVMGELAAKLSDLIILTHEDTYLEAPEKIIGEIEPGVKRGGKILGKTYWKLTRREEAIKKAIEMAQKGDSVLITGVGHQLSLNIGGQEVPWSDQEKVKKALKINA